MGSVRMNRSRPRGRAAGILAALTVVLFAAPSAQADTTVIGEQSLQSNVPVLNATGQNIAVFQAPQPSPAARPTESAYSRRRSPPPAIPSR